MKREAPAVRIAYVSFYDPEDVRIWSGTGYHIARCLRDQGIDVVPIGPLNHQRAPVNILRYLFNRHVLRKNDHPHRDRGFLEHYARQVHEKLAAAGDVDLLFGPGVLPLAHVETDLPIVVWTDCTFASLKDYYAKFSNLSRRTIRDGHDADRRVLNRCDLLIMSCQWAIDSAVNDYGVARSKCALVPFGANLPGSRSRGEVDALIDARPRDRCRMLILSVDWERKGGGVALAVVEELNRRGLPTELTVVGCDPEGGRPLPSYVRPVGLIDKSTPEGTAEIGRLLGESHFLLLPTRADCTPIVYCEAASFGVPSLATRTGGVPSVITDGLNGQLFALDAPASAYADYVQRMFDDPDTYRRLARSSFAEYEARLNWEASGRKVRVLLEHLLADRPGVPLRRLIASPAA